MSGSAQPPPRSASMFDLTDTNVVITGGSFTINNFQGVPPQEPPSKGIDYAFTNHVVHRASHDSYDRPDPPRCHRKTRIRLLKDLQQWVSDTAPESSRIAWVSGSVGVGKTALGRTLAERLARSKLLAATLMLEEGRQNERQVLSTIAHQIFISTEEVHPYVLDALKTDPSLFSKSPEIQFARLLVEPFAKLPLNSQTCKLVLIDGLDVCQNPTHILQAICDAIPKLNGRFKFLILSRPRHCVKSFFEYDPQTLKLKPKRISLDEDPDAMKDIRKFLQARFDELKRSHPLGPGMSVPSTPPSTSSSQCSGQAQRQAQWPGKEALRTLVRRSSSGFIYPSIAMNYISASHGHPQDRLDIVLGGSPPSSPSDERFSDTDKPFAILDDLYHKILSAACACACAHAPSPSHQMQCYRDNWHALSDILSVLLASTTRIALPEPAKVHDKYVYATPTFIERVLGMKKGQVRLSLKDLCSLVCLDEGLNGYRKSEGPAKMMAASYPTVRFMHELPFAEFLLNRHRARSIWVDLDKARVAVAVGCLKVLQAGCYLADRCECEMNFTCEHSIDCEMTYRVGFFWASYSMTTSDPYLVESVLQFDPTYVFHRQLGDPEFKDWIFHWDWLGPFLQCLDSAPAFKDTPAFSHQIGKLSSFLQRFIEENHNMADRQFGDAGILLNCLKCLTQGRAQGQVARINLEISKCIWDAVHGILRGLHPLDITKSPSKLKESDNSLGGSFDGKSSGRSSSGSGGGGDQFENPSTIMRRAVKEVFQRLKTEIKAEEDWEEIRGEDRAVKDELNAV